MKKRAASERPFLLALFSTKCYRTVLQVCPYGLQGGFLKRLERAMGDYRKRVFAPKAACETRVDQVTAQMDTVCLLLLLVSVAVAVSLGGLSVGAIVAMSGYYYIFNVAIDYVVKIINNVPLCKNLVKRISLFYTYAEDMEGAEIRRVESLIFEGTIIYLIVGGNGFLLCFRWQDAILKKQILRNRGYLRWEGR